MRPSASTHLQHRLTRLTRLLAAAASLTQDQLDACAYVLLGTAPGCPGHWTKEQLLMDLQGRVEGLAEVARQEQDERDAWTRCLIAARRN